MTKLNHKHITAVHHARVLLRTTVKRSPEGPVRDGLDEDCERLKQVEEMLQHQIVNPTLPFEIPAEPELTNVRASDYRPYPGTGFGI